MKLTTFKSEITTVKSFPGLYTCAFKHRISSAEASLDYKGPPMDPKMWGEVLAFFQWTYDTTHSESQVRLFVNTQRKIWAAWAFPQEARTNMTAKELDTEEFKKQRAMFNDKDGWVYSGTVHHHCSMGAFQSGTDLSNEVTIDGLHITIGKMASDRYDMHARFSLYSHMFEPDMSLFWDIGAELSKSLPADLHDRVARHQMCEKVAPEAGFPDQWKMNLIEVKPTFPVSSCTSQSEFYRGSHYGQGYQTGGGSQSGGISNNIPKWVKERMAVGELALTLLAKPYAKDQQDIFADWIQELAYGDPVTDDDKNIKALLDILERYHVTVSELWNAIPAGNDLSPCISVYRSNQSSSPGAIGNGSGGVVVAGNNGKKDKEHKKGKKEEVKPQEVKVTVQQTVPEKKMLEETSPDYSSME